MARARELARDERVLHRGVCAGDCAGPVARRQLQEYGKLLRDSGFGADYGAKYGVGTGILNFGIYGLFIVLYYNPIGANWNAATLGCVFCMVCCCFKGSHPGNVWPIMVGYVAASFATKGLCAALGTDFTTAINAQAIVIGLCFANGGGGPPKGNFTLFCPVFQNRN